MLKKFKGFFSETSRIYIGRIADIGGIISLILIVIGWIISFFTLINLSNKIDIVEQKIDGNTAESTLLTYFSDIEDNNITGSYNLLSKSFQKDHPYNQYDSRLKDVVGFEGLNITELTGKNTAIQKVYLVEFGFKKRGKTPLQSKRGMYVIYDGNGWKINANSVLYENGWSSTACDFYKFDHCKNNFTTK